MLRRWTTVVLLAALVFPVAAQRSGDRYITCESGWFGRYKRCMVPTYGRVQLVRERSNRKCWQGQTWGWDRDSVWVDEGCKAEFRVGGDWGRGGGPGPGPGPDWDRNRDRGISTGAVVVGAVAAAAIIGAILASKDKQPAAPEEAVVVPDWALGRFHGYSPQADRDIDLTIATSGEVSGTLDKEPFTGRVASDGRLFLGDAAFTMKRQSWGFVATQVDDAENIVSFRRQ